jgi:hypothetical protein
MCACAVRAEGCERPVVRVAEKRSGNLLTPPLLAKLLELQALRKQPQATALHKRAGARRHALSTSANVFITDDSMREHAHKRVRTHARPPARPPARLPARLPAHKQRQTRAKQEAEPS